MSPIENKEHKPGPIGKERSLKNRKAKDIQQVEPDGQEKPSPGPVRTADPVLTKETKATPEMPAELGSMISVPAADYGTGAKVGIPCMSPLGGFFSSGDLWSLRNGDLKLFVVTV